MTNIANTAQVELHAPVAMAKNKGKTLETVQFLRFVAAAMVLFTHIGFFIHNRVDQGFPVWSDGTQGVALFFVISGFIMTITATPVLGRDGAARRFAVSRLIRIVPLYWAVNAAKLVGMLVVPGMIAVNPNVSNVIFSLLFMPARNAAGEIEVFYGVGWTLNFEMAFYALFALGLILRIRPSLLVVPILIVGIGLAQVKDDSWPAAAFLLSPKLIYFVWGVAIGEWYLARRSLPVAVSVVLIAVGAVMVFVPLGPLEVLWFPQLHFAAIVLGFVALERLIGEGIPRPLTFLGDISYSLYLTHPMVGVLSVVALHRIAGDLSNVVLFLLASIICIVVSALTFLFFERPVTLYLRKRFLSR